MPLTFPPDYPETLADLVTLFHQRLLSALPESRAVDLAHALVEDVRGAWGGTRVYIPRGDAYFRHQRDAALWREFSGSNQVALARRYGLSLTRVYDGLARERARRQGTKV